MLLFITNVLSFLTFLMLSIMLIAYFKLESGWGWVFLGIGAAMQEELWIPILLLIIYSFSACDRRRAMINLAGAGAVFGIFNLPFLIMNASAYIHAVLLPANQFLPFDSAAPIGYSIFMLAPQINIFGILFILAIIFISAIILITKSKKSIPILSMIPFMVLSHALPFYYYFFMLFFAIVVLND